MRPLATALLLLVGVVLPSGADPALAGDDPFTLEDSVALYEVHEMEWSPAGDRLAFVVQGVDLDADEDTSVLWVADLSGDAPRVAPRPGGPLHPRSPRWSPDGARLAFLGEDGDGTTQVYAEPAGGGAAVPLTTLAYGALDFAWDPRGRWLVVLAFPDPVDEDGGGEEEDDAPESVAWRESDRTDGPDILRLPDAGGAPEPLLHGFDGGIQEIACDAVRPVVWFVSGPRGSHSKDLVPYELHEVPLAGGPPRRRTEDPAAEEFPVPLPDGRLAWVAHGGIGPGGRPRTTETLPRVLDPATGAVRVLAGGGTHDFSAPADRAPFAPSADGKSLVAIATRGRRREVVAVDLESGKVRPLGGPVTAVDALAVAPRTGRIAVAGGTVDRLTEVWVAPSADRMAEAKPVTNLHGGLDGRARPRVEPVEWTAPDGLAIEGLLVSPAGAAADARLPLVVSLHGGPWDADLESLPYLAAWWGPTTVFAASGRRTLLVNYRGSTGRGEPFLRAMDGAPVTGPAGDVAAGIDAMVARGVADRERVFLAGFSYGGAVVNGLLVSGRRFAAAVVGAGISDDVSFHGTSDGFLSTDTRYGAAPWEAPEMYVRESPVFHAGKCGTPTLFVHGTADERVPLGQSLEMFRALQRVGVATDVVYLEGEGHAFAYPSSRLAYARAMLDWFNAHDPGRK